ncbi:MAG: hypothetical protein ACI9SB_001500, partial [Candidatus Azotimanducaceae bacterium]
LQHRRFKGHKRQIRRAEVITGKISFTAIVTATIVE